MSAVHRTHGKRYAAGEAFELPPLAGLVTAPRGGPPVLDAGTPVAEGEPVRRTLRVTYFDTPDLLLSTGGLTLRRRTGDGDRGWHLEAPAGGGARSAVRLPLGGAARTVPAELLTMVRVRSRGADLRPVAQIVTDRVVHRLVDATGQVLAELADDRVRARRLAANGADRPARGTSTSWREVAVTGAAADLLDVIDTRLRERGLSAAPDLPEVSHVLAEWRGNAARPGGKGAAGRLTRKSGAGEVVLAHLRDQVEQIRTQDLLVRLDAPDSVHRMRVATRRLRSALTSFGPLFDADAVRPLRRELRWLAAELGAARDAEVMRNRVAAALDGGDVLGAASGQATTELDEAYSRAHGRVLAEVSGERYHRLLHGLDELLTTPPLTRRADTRAGRVLPRLVAGSYTAVRRLVEEAGAEPAGDHREELLHDARKAAKAARYAAESVARVEGGDATAFAEAMEAVQEVLGEHQDSVLMRQRLRELATSASSPELAFLYGRMDALEEIRADEAKRRFADVWKAAERGSLRRWMR